MLDERSRSIELPSSLRSLFSLSLSLPRAFPLSSAVLGNRERTIARCCELHLALAHRLASNPPTDRPTDHWTDRWMDGPTNGGANPRLAKWRNYAQLKEASIVDRDRRGIFAHGEKRSSKSAKRDLIEIEDKIFRKRGISLDRRRISQAHRSM
jgi:hypothetical protein